MRFHNVIQILISWLWFWLGEQATKMDHSLMQASDQFLTFVPLFIYSMITAQSNVQ